MRNKRIRVGKGVSVYLRHQQYWIDSRGGGERIRRPLHTKDQSQAIQKALDILNRKSSVQGKFLTLSEALVKYEEQYKRHNRKSSARRSMPVLKAFIASVGNERVASSLERQHVVHFRDGRAESLSPHTANGDLARIRAFANWLRAEGYLDKDPCFKVKRLKVSNVAREAISPDTVKAVLKELEPHPYFHDYVNVLANTGMRPQEALHVRGHDLLPDQKILHIRAWGDWEIKDSEDRKIVLNDTAFTVLTRRKMAHGDDSVPLFPSPRGLVYHYRNFFREYKKPLPERLKHVSPYSFRHYFATRCIAEGWRIEKLSRYLGHASIQTTQRYYVDMRAVETGAPPEVVPGWDKATKKRSRSAR